MAETADHALNEQALYALFPAQCVESVTEYGDGPCALIGSCVPLALARYQSERITAEQALERVTEVATSIANSGCTGKWLQEDVGCFADPVECGQHHPDFGTVQ